MFYNRIDSYLLSSKIYSGDFNDYYHSFYGIVLMSNKWN